MMCGWFSAAAARASARKRRRNASSSARAGCRIFTATRRRRRTSSARNTWADAPVPMGARRRYRPPRTRPRWSAIRVEATFARVPCAAAQPPAITWGRIGPVLRRLIITLIAAVAVGGIVFAFSGPTQEDSSDLPPAVESVFPLKGNLELRQVEIVADLAPGYTGYLAIDGNEVPEDEIQIVPALNRVSLRPGPGSDFEVL